VFDIKLAKNGRVSCTISDGDFFTKGLIHDDSILKQGTFGNMQDKVILQLFAYKDMEY